jgi:hypothetical protein
MGQIGGGKGGWRDLNPLLEKRDKSAGERVGGGI